MGLLRVGYKHMTPIIIVVESFIQGQRESNGIVIALAFKEPTQIIIALHTSDNHLPSKIFLLD